MKTRFRALHDYTAKLPLCAATESEELAGLTTRQAIELGVMNGITFEIEGYAARMRSQIEDLCVIFTGGDANFFVKRIKNTIFANCNLVFAD
ncbi:MAG: type III pantothenate kinase [Bacteroides thetaiotaomicron]